MLLLVGFAITSLPRATVLLYAYACRYGIVGFMYHRNGEWQYANNEYAYRNRHGKHQYRHYHRSSRLVPYQSSLTVLRHWYHWQQRQVPPRSRHE